MQIAFVEIQNFRKLKSVRIDLSRETTLLVGANNSGKTSAMLALRDFLVGPRRGFTANDFTLSNWATINAIGAAWTRGDADPGTATAWEALLPSLDLWLEVEATQIHYVRSLLPTLSWQAGRLGVRLRLEPKSILELQKAFLTALRAADEVRKATGKTDVLTVWPTDLKSFLDRKLREYFTVRCYSLDPSKCEEPKNGIAKPQPMPNGSEPIEGDPLAGLIRVDEISAQRGFTDSAAGRLDGDDSRERRLLSEQLRAYYARHLDLSDAPDTADLDALQAIENAQAIFDERLTTGFSSALQELSTLNYPGITDARLRIATKVRPTDGLNHSAAVQYDVLPEGESGAKLRLPEEYNGLGYQNLISMVFRLMSFRDDWMRVGKAASSTSAADGPIPPLHLVLIEEPEAHLHVQVQQVFLRKAYDVLRNHSALKGNTQIRTQMIVSTHSSHVAHEMEFASVRYFRRMQRAGTGSVPISGVVNLSEVFGPNDETAKFVTRYLRATHCDLFFADAAILVEGPAERMLIPHFIRRDFERLHCSYVSILEIGGSHAHRLRGLIEHLGLSTLVVTDIDSCVQVESRLKSVAPQRRAGQKSRNATLASWHPEKNALDELLDLSAADKVKRSDDDSWSLRVAYQVPVQVEMTAGTASEALCTTFEDSLIFENIELFRALEGTGLIGGVREALAETTDVAQFSAYLSQALKGADKGRFALEVLWHDKITNQLKPPRYINEGLSWLQEQLRQHEMVAAALAASSQSTSTGDASGGPPTGASAADTPAVSPGDASAGDISAGPAASASAGDSSAPPAASASAGDSLAAVAASASAADTSAAARVSASAADKSVASPVGASAADTSAASRADPSAADTSAASTQPVQLAMPWSEPKS